MKYALGGVILAVLAAGAYFIFFKPGPAVDPSNLSTTIAAPADHIFLHPKAIEMPFGVSKMDYAAQLFKEQRYDDAVAAWAAAYQSSHAADTKASALLMAGQALSLKETPEDRKEAEKLYRLYLSEFPKDSHADNAYFSLGKIAIEKRETSNALVYFTTLLDEFPNSSFAPSAAFAARYAAAVVAEQDRSLRGRLMAKIQPFLPRNATALVSVLTSSITLLIWLAYNWENSYRKLVHHKDPMLWALVLLLIVLAGANYVLEDQKEAQSTVDALKALSDVGK